MDINVSIKCKDQTIQVKLIDLVKYEFFKNLLTNFNTQITHEKKTILSSNGVSQNVDVYVIPELIVSCKSTTLLELIYPVKELTIYPDTYTEDLLEYMHYNQMYEFNHYIRYNCWGKMEDNYFGILTYIKQKQPNVNVYTFLRNFKSWYSLLEHSFKVCHLGLVDPILIPDMLECIDLVILHDYNAYDMYFNEPIVNLLHCLVYCCTIGFVETIQGKINDEKIKFILQVYIQKNKIHCTDSHHADYFIGLFYSNLDKIFVELIELAKLGVINMAEIWPIDQYRVYGVPKDTNKKIDEYNN